MWKNISFGGIAFCFALGAYEYKVHMDHHHGPKFEHEANAYPFRKMRNKAFPWDCPDCGLFESEWSVCVTVLFVGRVCRTRRVVRALCASIFVMPNCFTDVVVESAGV